MRRGVAGLVAVGALALPAAALAEPVDLSVKAPKRAAAKHAITVRVTVRADPGALDIRTAPLRLRVRLAPECGASFGGTTGPTAIDRVLRPAPATGKAYKATLSGKAKVRYFKTYAVCAFLEEKVDSRQFATAVDTTVKVTKRCTTATNKVPKLQRRLRHTHGRKAKAKVGKQIRAARKAVKRAC